MVRAGEAGVKIKLGVLGVEDSLQVVRDIVAEYPEFECYPCLWRKIDDVVPLLQQYDADVDMWLSAGRIPYLTALEWGGLSHPIFHLPYKGASLYRTLCKAFYTQTVKMNEISFDSILADDLKQVFDELEIGEEPAHVRPFQTGMSEEDNVQYHYDLWKSGKTKLAITCAWNVKKGLEALGVPYYRVLPARSAVEATLNMMLRLYEMQGVRDAQIAVQILEFDALSGASQEWRSADDLYSEEMKIKQRLIAYAKRVQGSLKVAGPGRFIIFTTRGMLREITAEFSGMPVDDAYLPLEQGLAACGIGVGLSAYEAEFYAAKALLQAKAQGPGAWMVLFDDKTVVGPLGRREKMTYSCNAAHLQTASERTSISVSTLSKIEGILQREKHADISAAELAQRLQIMPRSARRIVQLLEKAGMAVVSGEETLSRRGRPRKRYKILLGQK